MNNLHNMITRIVAVGNYGQPWYICFFVSQSSPLFIVLRYNLFQYPYNHSVHWRGITSPFVVGLVMHPLNSLDNLSHGRPRDSFPVAITLLTNRCRRHTLPTKRFMGRPRLGIQLCPITRCSSYPTMLNNCVATVLSNCGAT